jgi:hypothetical protein
VERTKRLCILQRQREDVGLGKADHRPKGGSDGRCLSRDPLQNGKHDVWILLWVECTNLARTHNGYFGGQRRAELIPLVLPNAEDPLGNG